MKKHILLVTSLLLATMLPTTPVNAASLYVTQNNITLAEDDGPLRFQLRLTQEPSPDTVNISYATNGHCLIGYEVTNFSPNGTAVTKSDILEFAVIPVNDSSYNEGRICEIKYNTTSSVGALNNLKFTQTFPITDDGDAPATIPGLFTTVLGPDSINEGASNIYSFGIGPSTAPSDPITISASTNDGQCELVQGQNTSTYLEYTIPKGVKGAAIFSARTINDDIVEGSHTCTITHSVRTEDTTYSGMTADSTTIAIIDDEESYDSQETNAEALVKRKSFGKLDQTDVNNDGVADNEQPNVAPFVNSVTGKRQAIIVESTQQDGCIAVSTPSVIDESENKFQDENRHFPHGLLDFKVICAKEGAEAKVTYLLDDNYNTSEIEIVKYSDESKYQKIEEVMIKDFKTQTSTVTSISYFVKDGSSLDADGTKNGNIQDPVGIAVDVSAPQISYREEINDLNEGSSNTLLFVLPPLFIGTGFVAFLHFHKRRH